jgi:undecaprenyl-diphosphatase
MVTDLVVALVAGLVQGVFEWLPISSEGNVAIALAAMGRDPAGAVQFALFLHAGTAVSASAYYRSELVDLLGALPTVTTGPDADGTDRTLVFLVVATLTSGVVGGVAYLGLEAVVSELAGGAFVAAIGALLVATGFLQRYADGVALGDRADPDLTDAAIVGALQGLAILPGVSRSGTTVSALLLRGHDGASAFRLSFLLSIPAALGAGVLAIADAGGMPAVAPWPAVVALIVAALVGYLTIDALLRVVQRVAFWGVCVGLGGLAVVGGLLVVVSGV